MLSKGIRSLWRLVAQRIFVISFLNFMIGGSFFVTGQRGGIRRLCVKAHYLAHPDQWRCQSVDKLWQWGHVPYFLRTMSRVLLHPFSNWCARMRQGLKVQSPETWSYNCLNCLNRLGATETMQKIVKKPLNTPHRLTVDYIWERAKQYFRWPWAIGSTSCWNYSDFFFRAARAYN